MPDSSTLFDALCAAHGPSGSGGSFAPGCVFGDWRLSAFIGRGGSGEVYCAEHVALGTPAAVKILVREGEPAKTRFGREARLLAELKSPAFPRFLGYGASGGRAWLAMELLEPGDLPSGDRAVARFLLRICGAVAELHSLGIVHRDIKPGNILYRGTSPVLADLGLAKAVASPSAGAPSAPGLPSVSAVGTPGYGAPEQMERGEASAAADVHALGVLADRCFGGNPPPCWRRVIERATSSLPGRRYQSAAAFARAVRMRHLRRTAAAASVCALAASAAAAALLLRRGPEATSAPPPERGGEHVPPAGGEAANAAWERLCSKGRLDIVSEKILKDETTPSGGRKTRFRLVTNSVEGTVVRLPPGRTVIDRPVVLAPGEYEILGPGTLVADISGPAGATVRMRGCTLDNMTVSPAPENGVRYVLDHAYLNFAQMRENIPARRQVRIEDGAHGHLRFRGPMDFADVAQDCGTGMRKEPEGREER